MLTHHLKESRIRRTMKKRHKGRALKGTSGLVGNDAFVRDTNIHYSYNSNAQARCLDSIQVNKCLLLLLLLWPSHQNENGHAQEVLSVEGLTPGVAGCC